MKREGQVRIPSGCAISAVISREGRRMTGEKIVESMIPMHDRSNGLGGGFAAYGIYPEYRDYYAFHIFFDSRDTRKTCEALLKEGFEIVKAEHIPIRQIPEITDVPLIWRYFLAPMQSVLNRLQLDAEEYVARIGAVDKVTFILVLTNKKDAHRRHPACFIIRFRFNAVADKRQWSSAASKPRRKTRAKLCSRFCAENEPSHQTCRSFSASR